MKIFKSFIIFSVFKEADLIFYNSEKVLTSLHKKLKKLKSATSSLSVSSHSIDTVNTWSTFQNIHDLQNYASNICNISAYIEASLFFHWWFDRFLDASLGKVIADAETEKTLCKHKKETQEHAKWQSETRKVVQRMKY